MEFTRNLLSAFSKPSTDLHLDLPLSPQSPSSTTPPDKTCESAADPDTVENSQPDFDENNTSVQPGDVESLVGSSKAGNNEHGTRNSHIKNSRREHLSSDPYKATHDEIRKAKISQRAAEKSEQTAREAQRVAERELQKTTQELQELHQRYRTVEIAFKEALHEQSQELQSLRRQASAAAQLRLGLEETKETLGMTQNLLEETQNLLETRTIELKDAHTFLEKTDGVSHAEVLGLLQTLNGEILQSSAHISEAFTMQSRSSSAADKGVPDSLRERVTVLLGTEAERCLSRVRQGSAVDGVFVLQMALQSLFTRWAEVVVSSWRLGELAQNGDSQHLDKLSVTTLLGGVHEAMYQSEPQAVSARWRALTRQYLTASSSLPRPTYPDAICRRIMDSVSDVLRISGFFVDTEDTRLIATTGESAIAGKIRDFMHLCVQLRNYVGERISSSDFVVVRPLPGTEFTSQQMCDPYNGGPRRNTEPTGQVMFVTELGIRRREKVAKPTTLGGSSIVETVTKKAGVFLVSSASELFAFNDEMECT